MASQVFMLTEEDVERSDTLTDDDIGLWALLVNGAIIQTSENKSEILSAQRSAEGLPTELNFENMLMGELQCDAGDDNDDDQGGVWGGSLYDNTVGEGEWNDQEVSRDW